MLRGALFSLAMIALAACASAPHDSVASPAAIGALATNDLLSRGEFMMYRVDDVEAVHYAEAAAAYGAVKLAALTDDRATIEKLAARYRRLADENVPNTANHVDANVIGVWPLALYEATGGEDLLAEGFALADGQWAETRADGLTEQARFWIDDVWMIGALQAEAWRLTDEDRFVDRAALTARIYLERLQQPNGLFHHGPEAPHFWGRGNGWVAAGLAEILGIVPRQHPDWEPILAGFHRMMDALLEYQAPDGMWRQLIDRPDSWAETSATAMFAYAMHAGVRMGFLGSDHYDAAIKAWRVFDYLDDKGRLTWICAGTGQSADPQYYLDRPVVTGDLHGQAAMLWLEAEVLRVLSLG